ncbi:MAG: transcriptional regulator [Rhodanobacteraceae bacterium]
MKTVSFEIASPRSAVDRVIAEVRSGRAAGLARVTFRSPESMARVLTPTRWTILQAMTGAGPVGIRELARRVKRDVKGVHNDANALVSAGIVDHTEAGKYLFPFDRVKVNFELKAAA